MFIFGLIASKVRVYIRTVPYGCRKNPKIRRGKTFLPFVDKGQGNIVFGESRTTEKGRRMDNDDGLSERKTEKKEKVRESNRNSTKRRREQMTEGEKMEAREKDKQQKAEKESEVKYD